MADLTITALKVSPVKVLEDRTLPALTAIDAGTYVIIDPTTGKFKKGDATSAASSRKGYVAIKTATTAGQTITGVRKGLLDVGDALSGMNFDADVYLSATAGKLADASPGANEAQVVTINGGPGGGTFTLTFGGQTTAAIAYNAAASAVQTALENLSSVRKGNVIVSGSAGGPYTVTFVGELANTNEAAITTDATGLTGGTSPTVTVVSTDGTAAVVVGTVVPGFGSTGGDRLLRVDL